MTLDRFYIGTSLLLLLLSGTRCNPLPDDDRSSSSSSSSSEHQPPNIILMRPNFSESDVGYNNEDVMTPNMDELAQTGVILDRYYTGRVASGATAQLLTGRLMHTLGLQHDVIRPTTPYGMPLDVPTLMDKLKGAGYATHGLGKWPLGGYKKEYTPTYHGYDTFYGFYSPFTTAYNHSVMCPNNASDWGQDFWDSEGENMHPARPQDIVGTYQALLYRTRAARIIDRHDRNRPLFMSVYPFDPLPSTDLGPEAYVDLYKHRTEASDAQKRRWARCTVVDDIVGSIMEALKFNRMWKNTVFIYAGGKDAPYKGGFGWTDHQSYMQDWFKLSVEFRESITSAFMNSPLLSASRQGAHVTGMVHSTDLYSTMLHLAGIDQDEEEVYGINIWESISNGVPATRSSMLHFIDDGWALEGTPLYTDTFDTRIEAALMEGDYRINTGYRSGPGKNYWLYNITADPLMQHDLSELPAYHSQVRAMLHTLEQFHLKSAVPLHTLPSSASDPAACPRHHGGFYVPWK